MLRKRKAKKLIRTKMVLRTLRTQEALSQRGQSLLTHPPFHYPRRRPECSERVEERERESTRTRRVKPPWARRWRRSTRQSRRTVKVRRQSSRPSLVLRTRMEKVQEQHRPSWLGHQTRMAKRRRRREERRPHPSSASLQERQKRMVKELVQLRRPSWRRELRTRRAKGRRRCRPSSSSLRREQIRSLRTAKEHSRRTRHRILRIEMQREREHRRKEPSAKARARLSA